MKTVKKLLNASLALLFCLLGASCDKYNYTDELQHLGKRVEILESEVLQFNNEMEALKELIATIEEHGYVTGIVQNTDGSYTIQFNNGKSYTIRKGKNGTDGKDGKNGDASDFNISIAQDTDGYWYWTLNGEWILDGSGNKMRASGSDGKDGKDGKDGMDGQDGMDGKDGKNGKDGKTGTVIIPQVRINDVTRHWEISTDGGITWEDTGILADGKDGKDGQDGKDGAPDIFTNIIVSEDGKTITFVLSDGRTFTVLVE
jgi:hypothetical protein